MFRFFILSVAIVGVVCGAPQTTKSNLDVDGRIVGGNDTTIEAHPYIVSILEHGGHYCGGVIISSTWIVTAAHCFRDFVSAYSVRAGSTIRNTGGEVIPARRILIHADYLRSTLDYDIALIELLHPITIPVARPIGLAHEGAKPSPGTTATVTGWGALSEGGPMATVLQVVQVPIVSQMECREAYGHTRITERMFCAGLVGIGGKDACQGDSGGPLVTNGVLTGIVSWGSGCARPLRPGVYASIPNLRTWIKYVSGI